MTDREKLVELLEDATKETVDGIRFRYKFETVEQLADHLIANGVTVKQMQKPLTVEEAREMPDVVWVEWAFGGCEPRIQSTIDIDTIYNKEHYYGKTWRCWAKKPTEEERKAAEWER